MAKPAGGKLGRGRHGTLAFKAKAMLIRISVTFFTVLLLSSLDAAEPHADFVGRTFLYQIDRDGSNLYRFSEAGLPAMPWNGSPEWSRDGTRIAFDATPARGRFRESHIAVYHTAGPKKGETSDLGLGNAPSWSPDDQQIAFMVNTGTGAGQAGTWVMNADGGKRKWLCNGFLPNWSPDGRHIISIASFTKEHRLVVYDTKSGESRPFGSDASSFISQPSWSPDGKKLAAIARQNGVYTVGIYGLDTKSGEALEQVLWHEESRDGLLPGLWPTAVAWSPDRDELVVRFRSDNESWSRFYLLRLDGMTLLEPNAPNRKDWNAAWSRDGTRILFASERPLASHADSATPDR